MIQIFSRVSKEGLKIEIIDTGIGFNEVHPTSTANHFEHYSGIGLDNIDQRIKLLYGEKYGLTVESRINEGTTVRLLLPIQREESE